MQAIRARLWLPPRRLGVFVAVVVVLAAAFFVASSLSGPGSAPSTLEQDIKKMEAAVQASPNELSLRLALASAYRKADRSQEALTQYQQALAIDAKSEDALLGAGVTHQELGQVPEAIQAFTTIIAQNKDNSYAP